MPVSQKNGLLLFLSVFIFIFIFFWRQTTRRNRYGFVNCTRSRTATNGSATYNTCSYLSHFIHCVFLAVMHAGQKHYTESTIFGLGHFWLAEWYE